MQTGVFGKLPAHGDFVARGMSAPFRKVLDRWITANIGQKTLPENGLRVRLFLAGEPILGVIYQSHDRSGRVFPIVAVTGYTDQNQTDADLWCDAAAAVLADAIKQNSDASETVHNLTSINSSAQPADVPFDAIWQKGEPPAPVAQALAQLNSD